MFRKSRFRAPLLRFATSGAVLATAFSVPAALSAQSDNARISGAVTDVSGAAIPGATITVTSLDTGAVRTITSGGSGDFQLSALQPGRYKASIVANGFGTQELNFQLVVSQVQALNFKLAPGSVSTQVDVTDAAPQIDLATSDTGTVIQDRQLTDLPLNGRNFTQLALLAPGITRGQSNNSASGYQKGNQPVETLRFNETGGASISANGLRPQANNFLLDGLDNNESLVNTIVIFPPVDALGEFRVTNSLAPAEFGRAGGAIIQALTRSGTNAIHGSAFIFYRDSKLASANPNYQFNNQFTPQTSFHRNQFGGTLGGALIKDRVFLFGSYQGLRQVIPNSSLSFNTVPTAKMRTGDFSDLLGSSQTVVPTVYTGPTGPYSPTGCASFKTVHGIVVTSQTQLNASIDNGAIFDPTTCAQFGTVAAPNIIPMNRLNPVAIKYLNAFPAANRTPTSQVLENYQNQQVSKTTDNEYDARLDFHLSSRDLVFVRGNTDNYNQILSTALATLPSGFGAGNNDTHPRELGAGYTRTISPNLVNDFRFGYTRPYYSYLNPDSNVALDTQLGIPNGNRNSLLGGISLIGGNNSEISYTGDGGPYTVPQATFQFLDALSYSRGKHNFRVGANIIHREVDFFQAQYNAKGFFDIGGGGADYTGYEVSELAAAFVDNYNLSNPTGLFRTISYESGYFIQDDWKISHRLTLNLGLRYDLYTHPVEANNQQSNFDIATASLLVAGQNGNSRSLINTDYKNFAPRLGFAYDLYGNGRTALRGGYGIYYFLDRGGVGNQLSNNPDFNGSADYSSANGYRIDLSGAAPNVAPSPQTAPGPYAGNNSTLATGTLPNAKANVNEAAPTNATVISYPKNNPTSTIQQFNLGVEQQLGGKTTLAITYVGTTSTHLTNTINYSAPQLGTGTKFFQAQGLNVTEVVDSGHSHYDGLQTRLNRTLSNGAQLTASYTWSHSTDNSVGAFSPEGASSVPITAQGPQFGLNRGDSDDDQRNFFTLGALYELPIGRGKRFGGNMNRGLNYLVGGFQFSPFIVIGSGTPFDISAPADNAGVTVRPDLISNVNLFLKPNVQNNFSTLNVADFAQAPMVNGLYTRVGNVHRNQFHGPKTDNVSLSVFKDIPIYEHVVAQLRGQVYNLLNTPQFANPSDTSINNQPFSNLTNLDYFSQRLVEVAFRLTF